MPKDTFLHLKEEKREQIIEAGIIEFSRYPMHEASINRIIKEADISKGSFYQYFHDKYEFYWYIIKLMIRSRISRYDVLLDEHHGDLFETDMAQLKELLELSKDEHYTELMKHVFVHDYHEVKREVFDHDEVNFSLMYQIYMNHKPRNYYISEEDFNALYDMIRTLSHATLIDILRGVYTKQYALTLYQKQMNLIKKGQGETIG